MFCCSGFSKPFVENKVQRRSAFLTIVRCQTLYWCSSCQSVYTAKLSCPIEMIRWSRSAVTVGGWIWYSVALSCQFASSSSRCVQNRYRLTLWVETLYPSAFQANDVVLVFYGVKHIILEFRSNADWTQEWLKTRQNFIVGERWSHLKNVRCA